MLYLCSVFTSCSYVSFTESIKDKLSDKVGGIFGGNKGSSGGQQSGYGDDNQGGSNY